MITEQHYSPQAIADAWQVSPDYVRRRFRKEPGVLKLGSSWRIPQSVVERVYLHAQGPKMAPPRVKYFARRSKTGAAILVPRLPTIS